MSNGCRREKTETQGETGARGVNRVKRTLCSTFCSEATRSPVAAKGSALAVGSHFTLAS